MKLKRGGGKEKSLSIFLANLLELIMKIWRLGIFLCISLCDLAKLKFCD
jgi:hypothetical protein